MPVHSIRVLFLAAALGLPSAGLAQQPPASSGSNFTVFVRSVPVGNEHIGLARSGDGWTITSSGRVSAPVDIINRQVQIRYDSDWKPLELTIDATSRGQTMSVRTTVSGTTATSSVNNTGQPPTQNTNTIAADALLLPTGFFAGYEAVAARLKTAASGSTLSGFGFPPLPLTIQVGDSTSEQIQTSERLINVRRTRVTMVPTGAPAIVGAEIWADENGRFLRLSVPSENLEVAREDVASVAARRVATSRAGDEQVKMSGNGFTLVGTLSKPNGAAGGRFPAVVMVGGAGPTDRDETVAGVPILGQLANALADAGFLVLRYDKRGVGMSGGRTEEARLLDFAEDLRAVVKFVTNRKDVDRKRVTVIGYGEGGAVATLAATKEKGITALVLMATGGTSGADLTLEQTRRGLERTNRPEAEKQSVLELQRKMQAAVVAGSGWEGISPELRRASDTAWFQSYLSYDPAKIIPDVRQPLLIVHGELDRQVDPTNADKLEALAKTRKNKAPVEVVKIPGVNHLMVSAATGEPDEYPSLSTRSVNPSVGSAIAAWLQKSAAAGR